LHSAGIVAELDVPDEFHVGGESLGNVSLQCPNVVRVELETHIGVVDLSHNLKTLTRRCEKIARIVTWVKGFNGKHDPGLGRHRGRYTKTVDYAVKLSLPWHSATDCTNREHDLKSLQ
jgi:hypothetical protein